MKLIVLLVIAGALAVLVEKFADWATNGLWISQEEEEDE